MKKYFANQPVWIFLTKMMTPGKASNFIFYQNEKKKVDLKNEKFLVNYESGIIFTKIESHNGRKL